MTANPTEPQPILSVEPDTSTQIEGLEALRSLAEIQQPELTVQGHAEISQSRRVLQRHAAKFVSFGAIGGGIFVVGLALQAALTSGAHMPSFISYLIQTFLSVEASFLLNRWITWRRVETSFWPALGRFNVQKVITVTVNVLLYAGLLKLGMNYLLDNILLTAVFTLVNYVGADRFVFLQRGIETPAVAVAANVPARLSANAPVRRLTPRPQAFLRDQPAVSVVIPCRGNETTIRAAVDSILGQDYSQLRELVLVGSPGDTTWRALEGVRDPRLVVLETETPPGIRDANFKRDFGICQTSGDLISLIDSDMVIPPNWLSDAVQLLIESESDCVAGVMRSIHDDFWGRFVDRNRLGAKTPRANGSYLVTAENFGAGAKPPITADILFTREMYERCPIDSSWSHGSLEDYEWFWRVVNSGHQVLVSDQLYGWHHHRSGLKKLAAEYRRSARGCAFFIRAHGTSPFARRRLVQSIALPSLVLLVLLALVAAALTGHGLVAMATLMTAMVVAGLLLSGLEFARTRTMESLLYPVPALLLGVNYTASLSAHLIGKTVMNTGSATYVEVSTPISTVRDPGRRVSRLLRPLTLILILQAGLSASLIWINTAFNDEGEYLWAGHLEIAHWLHGKQLPDLLTHTLSGSPIIYPPLGAMADAVGGLAAARMLSMIFMLMTTVLLYSVAKRLLGRNAAVFASALWAISEPTVRLGAYATYDALSIFLTALAVWLAMRAANSPRRAEYVAAAAVVLALANADAYSGVVIDPAVILFVFFAWMPIMGTRRAVYCAGWMVGALLVAFTAVMTISGSWQGILFSIFLRGSTGGFTYQASTFAFILKNIWGYSGLYLVLVPIGLFLVFRFERGAARWMLLTAAVAVLIVPIAQIHDMTTMSLDKHLAYGVWFAVLVCGYGCQKMIRTLPSAPRIVMILCSVFALAYPVSNSWQAAFYKQLGWSNTTAFNRAFDPVVESVSGEIDASTQSYVARYYSKQGYNWNRWNEKGLPASFPGVPVQQQTSRYASLLRQENYGAVALFYTTTIRDFPATEAISSQGSIARERILSLLAAGNSSPSPSNQGLASLTLALEGDPSYRLVSVGPYNSSTTTGAFAIWEKVSK